MSGGLYSERMATRIRRRCERCTDWIELGTRYVRASLPPWTEPNESDGWWTLYLHGRHWEDCPAHAAALARVDARSAS